MILAPALSVLLLLQSADTTLVARARQSPDDVRAELQRLLARGAAATASGALDSARSLAASYALAWRDSFLVSRVAFFAQLTSSQRRAKVRGDSVRLAGNRTLERAGVDAAMRKWRESQRILERIGDSAGVALALGNLGVGYLRREELDSAESYLIRSRQLAARVGDFRAAANALGALGDVSRVRGNLREARELFLQAQEARPLTGDTRGLAADRNNLGLIAQELGDLAGARTSFEAALALNREHDRESLAATNLVNLANILGLEGRYEDAQRTYREALAVYRAQDSKPDAAFVLHGLGGLAMRRGDYRAAIAAIGDAAAIYERTGPLVDEIAARTDLFHALAAVGNLERARAELLRAEGLAASEPVTTRAALQARLALSRGDMELQFNRLAIAERHYRRATELSRGISGLETRARALDGLGMVLLVREEYAPAQAALESALRAHEAASDPRSAALTRLLLAYAARHRGDTALARRSARRALDSLVALRDAVGEAAALGSLADLQLAQGLRVTAESLYHRGLARLTGLTAPDVAWQLHAGVAHAAGARGDLAESARALHRAIQQIERVSGALAIEERRTEYLADKWDVYADLALVEHRRGSAESAFAASERLRARQMLDLLARGRVALPARATALAEREQDARRRITELTKALDATAIDDASLRGPGLAAQRSVTLEALAEAQQSYTELLVSMREAHPGYATIVQGETAALADVQRALAPTDVLLEYLVGDSTTLLFVVTSTGVNTIDLSIPHEALTALIEFARATMSKPSGGGGDDWRAPMRRLYRQLLAPAEERGLLEGKRRLIIAPHVELHYLPFAALARSDAKDDLLLQRYIVEYVPSASVWLALRERRVPRPQRGVLALAPRVDRLPGSRAEVAAVQRIYGRSATTLVGRSATESAFHDLAGQYDVVHVASFGVLNKHNPLFSFVELAGSEGQDGRLEVHEVFGLDLRARLLVLSACQTGVASGTLADVPAGDDWVGLVRAFLFAGASNVVATLWPVADASTAAFMERFHRRFASSDAPGEVLAETQRAAARDPRTSHPFYWAGFALVTGQ